MALSWMGTNFLAVAVLAAPSGYRLFVGFRANRWRGVSQEFRSAPLYTYTIAVWTILFLIGMGRFIYSDHTSLVKANTALRKENKELRLQKSGSPFTISVDNEYASITNTVQAFRSLMPQQT